jgi:hypothetical protein
MFKFMGSVVKVARTLVLFSFLAALVVLPHNASAQTTRGDGVLGVVYVNLLDGATGRNLAGAGVTIWDMGGAIVAEGVTDKGGYFKARLAPGSYSSVAQAKGYLSSVANVSIPLTGGVSKVVLSMTRNVPGTSASLRGR